MDLQTPDAESEGILPNIEHENIRGANAFS